MANRVARVETVARLGFLARGIVYILLGWFAFRTTDGEGTGTSAVMQQLDSAGVWLLALVGLGLAAYGFFRLYTAILNLEPQGAGWKGIARRIGHSASGFGHLVLAFTAFQIVMSDATAGSGDGGAQQDAARTILDLPLGSIILTLFGLGFFGAAAEQATKAATGKFMRLLKADAPRFTEILGRVGYAARALVFCIIGFAIAKAVLHTNGAEVKGLGGALSMLAGSGALYTITALGLIAFGAFSIVMARYRTIRDDDVIARLKSAG